MPLEIRELVIKATVGDTAEGGSKPGSTTPSSETTQNPDAQIMLIVEKVLEILRDKAER